MPGANETPNVGLIRPPDGWTEWSLGDDEELNINPYLLDAILAPYGAGGHYQCRYVAPSFAGLPFAAATGKFFDSIQDAIDDVNPGNYYPEPIYIYSGFYYEELNIRDRSIHLIAQSPYHVGSGVNDTVFLRSNRDSAAATGHACINVHLRSGEDDTHPNGQDISLLDGHLHSTRRGRKIVFSNFFFDNYGKYYLNEAHDINTTYCLDCTDEGVPPYRGENTYIIFNKCCFRSQTWRHHTEDGSELCSWFEYGFRVKSFATRVRFIDCGTGFYNYGGGTYGKEGYFCGFKQPFYVGTDGTSFIGWQAFKDSDPNYPTYYNGDVNQTYGSGSYMLGYYMNRSQVDLWDTDINVFEWAGSSSFDPPGYTGNGWIYGHESDSSHAIATLENMGSFRIRRNTLHPSVWGEDADYGPASCLEYSNWYTLFTDPTPGSEAVLADHEAQEGADISVCSVEGFTTESAHRFGDECVVLNEYGNMIGGKVGRII